MIIQSQKIKIQVIKYILASVFLLTIYSCKLNKNVVDTNNTNTNNTKQPAKSKSVQTNNRIDLVKARFLDNGASTRMYVSFIVDENSDISTIRGRYSANYTIFTDNGIREKIENRIIPITEENISKEGKLATFFYDITKPKSSLAMAYVRTEIVERIKNVKLQNEIAVRFSGLKTNDNFGIFNSKNEYLSLKNYVNSNDTIYIKSLNNDEQDFLMVRYKHDFDPALSPIASGAKPAPKPLYVDTLIKVKANTPIVLNEPALYYIIKDTLDRSGLSIIGVDQRYPKFTRAESLKKPLVYISTNQEFLNLNAKNDDKKTLDQFWLGLYNGNQAAAKKTIKALYGRVEEANLQFTTYKEGWKTDKGMVYIVMGKPDQLKYLKDKEVWVYTQNAKYSEVNFTFSKRPNQFIEDHYELNRYAEFQPIWFPVVENWRLGEPTN